VARSRGYPRPPRQGPPDRARADSVNNEQLTSQCTARDRSRNRTTSMPIPSPVKCAGLSQRRCQALPPQASALTRPSVLIMRHQPIIHPASAHRYSIATLMFDSRSQSTPPMCQPSVRINRTTFLSRFR
jgi:hypothetical protein